MQRKTRKQKTKLKWIFIILYSLAVGLSVSIGLLDLWSQTETKRSDRASSAAYPKQREETGQTNEHERERTNQRAGTSAHRESARESSSTRERDKAGEERRVCNKWNWNEISVRERNEMGIHSQTKLLSGPWECMCVCVCALYAFMRVCVCMCGTEMAITACRQQQQQHNSNYT